MLSDGRIPWELRAVAPCHTNFVTAHRYSGMNTFILHNTPHVAPFWAGEGQIKKAGYRLKQHAKKIQIVYGKGGGKYPSYGTVGVYNLLDTTANPDDFTPIPSLSHSDLLKLYQARPSTVFGDVPAYNMAEDVIIVEPYGVMFDYYRMAIKSTSIPKRIGRDVSDPVREDLIDTIGAVLLLIETNTALPTPYFGVNDKIDVMSRIKLSDTWIFEVIADAQAAVNYILKR